MPQNRAIFLCASGVIVVSLATQLLAPRCQVEPTTTTTIEDPTWGLISNLTLTNTKDGTAFEATRARDYHRILRSGTVVTPGRYRVSIETQFEGTPDFAIEIGGKDQPYAFVVANLRTGKIEKANGDGIQAGSEPLGAPGRFRWWVEQTYVPGRVDYNFSILTNGTATQFSGQNSCRVVLANPDFRAVRE
jgi:hypothetical protein